MILDEYKKQIVKQNKRIFTPNFDYKAKLQAVMKLEKHTIALNKERPYYIINLDHDFHKNAMVEFHLKVAKLEELDIMVKS